MPFGVGNYPSTLDKSVNTTSLSVLSRKKRRKFSLNRLEAMVRGVDGALAAAAFFDLKWSIFFSSGKR